MVSYSDNADRDTSTIDSWFPHFIQTADPQFPTGAYAHSFGLEELVALGVIKSPEDLARFLACEISSVLAEQELPCLRFAYEAGVKQGLEDLLELDAHVQALLIVEESRKTSIKLGSQRLKLLRLLFSTPLVESYAEHCRDGSTPGHQAVVAGLQASLWGTPLRAALWAHLYQAYSQILQAAMKLIRIGQDRCQFLLSDALKQANPVIEASLEIERDAMGTSLTMLDIAASRHSTAFSRLFIS